MSESTFQAQLGPNFLYTFGTGLLRDLKDSTVFSSVFSGAT